MKKIFTLCAVLSLVLAMGSGASAGISPNRGLPQVTVVNTNLNKWSVASGTTSDNNAGSAMCVDCHTANPSAYLPPSAYPGGAFNLNFLGSHFVTRNFNETNTGGGYAGSKAGPRTAGGQYEKGDAWPSTAFSKYAVTNTFPVANTAAGTRGQLICESCHNIVKNTGTYKLLANGVLNGDSTICAGCHSDMEMAVNNEPSYFANDNTGTHHHRNTTAKTGYGGTATTTTHDMGYIAAATYGNATTPSRMWAASSGQLRALDRDIAFASANDNGVKNGTFTAGQINISSAIVLECMNCHRPHGGFTGTAALILQTGDNSAVSWGKVAAPSDRTTAYTALQRQSEAGDPSSSANRLIQDDRKLCAGCHTGYGQ